MRDIIARQQELISDVLQHTNSIDGIVEDDVIIVPKIKHLTGLIREKVMTILQLEQEIMLDIINKDFPHG